LTSLKLPVLGPCENCNGTNKLASKILAHAKVSIAKHLKETTEQRDAIHPERTEESSKQTVKHIPADKILEKLTKAKLKLSTVLNPKKKQTPEEAKTAQNLKMSVLGTFYERFNPDRFKSPNTVRALAKAFSQS